MNFDATQKICQSTECAALAWDKVHGAMLAMGAYHDVTFDDPAIHAVVEAMGGWPKLCRTQLSKLGYLQRRFMTAYRAFTCRDQFEFSHRLMGDRSPDAAYLRHGLPLPQPALVGDVHRAKAVYLGGSR